MLLGAVGQLRRLLLARRRQAPLGPVAGEHPGRDQEDEEDENGDRLVEHTLGSRHELELSGRTGRASRPPTTPGKFGRF